MNFSDINKFKHKRTAIACVVLMIALAVSPIFLTDVKSANIKLMAPTQVSWQDAMKGCSSLGEEWSLPSISQIAAIYYRHPDIKLVDDTDYWSHNAMAGFAFGMNTGWGIASFDRYADTDHFLCIQ